MNAGQIGKQIIAKFVHPWRESPATFKDVESFLHFEVSVNRDTYANRDLLSSRSESVEAL
jgi:hypothetical protein